SNVTKCPLEKGAILHFTAVDLLPYKLKIAWYHCVELLKTPDEAERINRFYFRDWDEKDIKLRPVLPEWVDGLFLQNLEPSSKSWQWTEIMNLFDKHGIEFFEPLEIWHIPQLRYEFLRRTGREPRGLSFFTRIRREGRRERKRFDRWVVDICRKLRHE
ncbi:MAG: hypothetical protein ACI4P0_02665, partial [Mailhella sp.]